MRKYKDRVAVLLLILVLSIAYLSLVYLILESRSISEERINTAVSEAVSKIKPIDGKTPIKGVDYFDGVDGLNGTNGVDGKDGKDAVSTHTKETIIKETPVNGVDGLTPEIRCNVSKNRWEVRYVPVDTWRIMYDEENQPTKCTIEP